MTASFEALWRQHGPHVPAALLAGPARAAFAAVAGTAPAPVQAFALECGLTGGVRPHLYLALGPAADSDTAPPSAPGVRYLRYTLNGAGRASVPLPHEPGPAARASWPAWLDVLAARGLPAATAGQALAWLGTLPAGAAIDSAAWLDRRPGQPLRLYVSGVLPGPGNGNAAGWPALPAAAAPLAALARRLVAVVDFDESGPRPRWGLELLTERHPDGALARWRPMIEALRAAGLCTPDRAEGVQAWCRGEGRRISHMKLMAEGQALRDARAFLLATPAPHQNRAS